MHVDQATRARARLALREAIRGWLFDPNVTLIDFGWPEREGRIAEEEPAIRVHVRQKLAEFALEAATDAGYTRPIPPSIGGFPTDVPQGTYLPQQWSRWSGWGRWGTTSPRSHRVNPLRGGVSISDEYHYVYGTLGGLVTDRATGAQMILSNWHVLVADWGARTGQRILQPGRSDGGTNADEIARLTRDAMSQNMDAAVATLTGNRRMINDQYGLGPVRGVGWAEPGMEVVKSGRRTGITYGRVTAIEGVFRLPCGYLERIIRNVVTIDQRQRLEQVSACGDSGSWWLERSTMRAIGLHFAGCDRPERALALDMQSVLNTLNVDLVT